MIKKRHGEGNRRGYLRKKRSELDISLSPKWIVWEKEREKEREKGQESRGWVQWGGAGFAT